MPRAEPKRQDLAPAVPCCCKRPRVHFADVAVAACVGIGRRDALSIKDSRTLGVGAGHADTKRIAQFDRINKRNNRRDGVLHGQYLQLQLRYVRELRRRRDLPFALARLQARNGADRHGLLPLRLAS